MIRHDLRYCALAVCLTVASCGFGRAFAQQEAKGLEPGAWPSKTFRWYYNPSGAPPWLTPTQAKQLVLTAASRWEACGLNMQFEGDSQLQPGRIDGRNVIGWSAKLPAQMRAVTIGKAADGILLERDIVFSDNRLEFQRFPRLMAKVMVHEFGHAIGLRHSPRCDDVMTLAASCPPIAPKNLPVEPTPHDLADCRALYGE